MKEKYIKINNLKVSEELLNFVNNELLKETEITPQNFWKGFDKTAHELSPRNDQLINIRETIQKKIDEWHIKNKGNHNKIDDYKKFLISSSITVIPSFVSLLCIVFSYISLSVCALVA